MRPRARRVAGFSLIELLLASAIAAVIMGGLYAAVAGGMTAWRRMQTAPSFDAMLALERMGRQFAGAPVFAGMPCEGTDHRVGFPALIHPTPGALPSTLGRVEYYYDAGTKTWCVQEQTYGGYLAKSAPLSQRALVTGVSAVTLEYLKLDTEAKQSTWVASWPPAKRAPDDPAPPAYPLAIRATVVVEDPRGGSVSYLKSVLHWVQ